MPEAPIVEGHWLLGSIPAMRSDPLGMLRDAARLGDVVRLRFAHVRLWLLTRPDHLQWVLQDNAKNYVKDTVPIRRTRALLGNGLFTSDGEHWLRQRRLMQPAFHRQKIAGFAEIMARAAGELADAWRAHAGAAPLDVAGEMTRLTMQVVSRTLLGGELLDELDEVARAVSATSELLVDRMLRAVAPPLWLPTRANRRFRAALRTLDEVVLRIIARRRAESGERDDLLGLLLAARDEATGEGMSDAELRDEVMTIFLAGHETTATALAWTWWLIAAHPGVERKLRDELAGLAGRAPGLADLERLRYTRMVIEESMRLYPPLWSLARRALAADEIDGHALPAGAVVIISPYLTHRHPSAWERPEEFDPERFAPERAQALPRFAYLPFLGGPRQCIGNAFAMMEAQLILATLAQRYRLTPTARSVEPEPYLTLRPKGGLPMRVALA